MLLNEKIKIEADYICATQYKGHKYGLYGILNNVYPVWKIWDWIVPRENALGILGLIIAYKVLHDEYYMETAEIVMHALLGLQESDGSWCDQYHIKNTKTKIHSKSPTQTAETMIAMGKLGFRERRYESMKKAAAYIIRCQDVNNKLGQDDGLICGGKDKSGNFNSDRWTQDNAFAYAAMTFAEEWAVQKGDDKFSRLVTQSKKQILSGINKYLYNPETGVWHRKINKDGIPDNSTNEWSNYSPLMIGVPVEVDLGRVAEWIHNTFQKESGGVVQNDGSTPLTTGGNLLSPGFSFQAAIAWQNIAEKRFFQQAIDWAETSGLWQIGSNPPGSWTDWVSTEGEKAPNWQRFIDTSFYAIAAWTGGYDFTSKSDGTIKI